MNKEKPIQERILEHHIKKNYISKQCVKEAIEKHCNSMDMEDLNDLLKELGLDDE